MRERSGSERLRTVSRLALVALVGGLAAACGPDTQRFAGNPFSNPFATGVGGSEPGMTGSLPEPTAAPPIATSPVQSEPLAEPAPRAAATPIYNQPSPTPVTPRPAAPVATGPGGWSAQGGTAITVGTGDNLNAIASRYGVPANAILSANGLKSASQVTPGRQIVIPVYHAAGAAIPATQPRLASPAAQTPKAQPAAQPKVRLVETKPPKIEPKPVTKPEPQPAKAAKAAPVAAPVKAAKAEPVKPIKTEPVKAAKVEPAKLAKAEPQKAAKAETLKPQKPAQPEPKAAKIEAPKVAQAEPKPVKPVAQEAKAPPRPPEPAKPEPSKVAKAEPQPEPSKPAAKDPDHTASVPKDPPKANFRWPATGRVIAGYGGNGGNEGINIAVPEGTPVKAAEAGTVAYAGSDVKGYGNLVLVRHENGYVSAYAHNGEIGVKPGEKVKRGQVIAKSGRTGNVTSPQLHFEIRKGASPIDPMQHLASN